LFDFFDCVFMAPSLLALSGLPRLIVDASPNLPLGGLVENPRAQESFLLALNREHGVETLYGTTLSGRRLLMGPGGVWNPVGPGTPLTGLPPLPSPINPLADAAPLGADSSAEGEGSSIGLFILFTIFAS
jgi:hypothetical protein